MSGPGRAADGFAVNFMRPAAGSVRARRIATIGTLIFLALNAGIAVWLVRSALVLRAENDAAALSLAAFTAADATEAKAEVAALQAETRERISWFQTTIAVESGRFDAAAKLAALSRLVPASVRITRLEVDATKRTLAVQATSPVDPREPYKTPVKEWVRLLKADPVFGRGIRMLQSQKPARRFKQSDRDLLDFDLAAAW